MLGRGIALTISCALGASAFLLPPGTSATSANKAVSLKPFEIDAKNQVIELPCSSCVFPAERVSEEQESDGIFWAQGGANNLVLNFTVSDNENSLLLNGGQLYPMQFNLLPEWHVQQIPASTTREQLKSGDFSGADLEITGYNLYRGEADVLSTQGDSIVTLTWQLTSLEGQDMSVDDVLIQMIETSEGELLILAIDPIPGTAQHFLPVPEMTPRPPKFVGGPEKFKPAPKPCTLPGPLCAIGHFFESKFGGLKPHGMGCGGKPAPFADGHLPSHVRPHFDQHGEPGHPHGPPHPHAHGHHHRHGLFHSVSSAILAIFAPVMAGIAVGMLVSVLGLLTGRFIGWLWFTVIRGGKRGYNRVAAHDIIITVTDTDADVDAKKSFGVEDNTEPLPRYEDAPAYEQTEKEVL